MIRWCSYCQTCQGETAPHDDYSLTHSICDDCVRLGRVRDKEHVSAMSAVARYYRQLRKASETGDFVEASALVDTGLGMGLAIGDLSWGILQPLLRNIGDRWALGEMSVTNEHLFSATAVAAVELLFAKDPALMPRRQHRQPRLLLLMAEGNYHTLGVRMAELGFCLQGYTTHTVMPGLPAREAFSLVRSLHPEAVGVSVALATQMRSVRELHGLVAALDPASRPRLVVGGPAVRMGLEVPAEWGIELYRENGPRFSL
jgi:methanogenic corrinoid protein MtbC1